MPKLSELRRAQRTITVNWKKDKDTVVPVQVTYDPSKITMASQDPDDGMSLHDFNESRCMQYVQGWDLMDDDGNPTPITKEGIGTLEMALVSQMIGDILADSRPNP